MDKYFITKQDCSEHSIFPGVNIFTSALSQLMISIVEMEPRAVVEPHAHPHEQMGLLLEGELNFTIGNETMRLVPGDMWRIPGNIEHTCTAGSEKVRALDVFSPVREDYR